MNDPYVLRDKSALFYGLKPYSKASLMVPQCNAKKTLMDLLTQCVIMQTENCVVGKRRGIVFFGVLFQFIYFLVQFNFIASYFKQGFRKRGAGGHAPSPPPTSDRSGNPISTGGQIMPTSYCTLLQIFRPSNIPVEQLPIFTQK